MGEQNVKQDNDEATHQGFMKSLLNEVRALEYMLAEGMIESGVRCIGAEQEMFIIDRSFGPAPRAIEILDSIEDERFTNELGLFNLEANLSPQKMKGDCLGLMEKELEELYREARQSAAKQIHRSQLP